MTGNKLGRFAKNEMRVDVCVCVGSVKEPLQL